MPVDITDLFSPWFQKQECELESVTVMTEKEGGRNQVFERLVTVAADHVVGLKAIESLGGFPKAANILRNRVPTRKIARSGFLGEILATEYVDQQTEYSVPVRRLRHRDTREQAMRGDDVLGFRTDRSRVKVIKVEAKSRANLTTAAIVEAREGLANYKGRPNPETLGFLDCILREQGRDDEAEPITKLQKQSIRTSDVCHLLFTLSGNNPTSFLEDNSDPVSKGMEFRLCGCRVNAHVDLVRSVFDECLARGESDGDA